MTLEKVTGVCVLQQVLPSRRVPRARADPSQTLLFVSLNDTPHKAFNQEKEPTMTVCPNTHTSPPSIPPSIPHSIPLSDHPAQPIDLEWDDENQVWLITGAFDELYRTQFAAAPEIDKMIVKSLCDPHADELLTPEQAARATDLGVEVLAEWLREMGVPPAAVFAFYRTGMIVTADSLKEFPSDSLEAWNRLITSHHVATDLFFWTLENTVEA